jgi:SRSO17 transposase
MRGFSCERSNMAYEVDGAAVARLDGYFARIGGHLKDRRKRESFAMYAFGILGDGERKSTEPIAARACGDPERAKNAHDKLLHFLSRSEWDDRAVRLESARYAIEALSKREPISTWIVDDTGFPKQGKHSVGVQRQYTGTAGKVTNCQIGVSLAVATRTEHVPLDFELYLPRCWADDAARREEARIPDDVLFRSQIDLALAMIARAASASIPGEIILADAAYGGSADFRNAVRVLGFDFAVQVQSGTRVVTLDARERPGSRALPLIELAQQRGHPAFRRFTWREGSKRALTSKFLFVRVRTAGDDGFAIDEHEPMWAIVEWPDDEPKPTKFFLTTLPRRMTKKQIIRVIKERWRIERMYEDLKGELGLDHFEGRSFPGWHHHVSVVLCCYAFVVAERARTFPPSARRACTSDSLGAAA